MLIYNKAIFKRFLRFLMRCMNSYDEMHPFYDDGGFLNPTDLDGMLFLLIFKIHMTPADFKDVEHFILFNYETDWRDTVRVSDILERYAKQRKR